MSLWSTNFVTGRLLFCWLSQNNFRRLPEANGIFVSSWPTSFSIPFSFHFLPAHPFFLVSFFLPSNFFGRSLSGQQPFFLLMRCWARQSDCVALSSGPETVGLTPRSARFLCSVSRRFGGQKKEFHWAFLRPPKENGVHVFWPDWRKQRP